MHFAYFATCIPRHDGSHYFSIALPLANSDKHDIEHGNYNLSRVKWRIGLYLGQIWLVKD
jgi:hypothetical protein